MTPPPGDAHLLGRRSFIAGLAVLAGGVAVGACGGGSSKESTWSASRLFDSRTLRPDGTPQRMVWAISDADGYVTSAAPDAITVSAVADDGTVLLEDVSLPVHGDGLLVPYYPLEMAFPDGAPVEFTFDADGATFSSFVDARGSDRDALVAPGDVMPSVATPLFDDPRGADPVCTRSPEPCPFHGVSLDDALAAGRPVVLNISTPAFCSNQIACGPGLEVLIEVAPEIDDDVAVIHSEVYAAPTARELGPVTPIMTATGLWYEPAVYVVRGDGRVSARLDFMWDTTELRSTLVTALS